MVTNNPYGPKDTPQPKFCLSNIENIHDYMQQELLLMCKINKEKIMFTKRYVVLWYSVTRNKYPTEIKIGKLSIMRI